MAIDTNMSEVESVPLCTNLGDGDVFAQYEMELNKYFKHLVDLYMDWLILYNLGIVGSLDFLPESVDDVYHNNLYCMSWFYEDVYPFEMLEDDIDCWLANRLIQEIMEWEYAEYLWKTRTESVDCAIEMSWICGATTCCTCYSTYLYHFLEIFLFRIMME